jgi:antitoxin ChpS
MYTTSLRKVGGSVMMAVPPAFLDLLHIGAGNTVGIEIDNGRLVVEPQLRPRYTLNELLAQCDSSSPLSVEDHTWLNSGPVGNELL